MNKVKLVLALCLLWLVLPSCNDSSSPSEISSDNTKLYYIQKYPGVDDEFPIAFSIWEYDVNSEQNTKLLDSSVICSNVNNDEFFFINPAKQLCLYNIISKEITTYPEIEINSLPLIYQTKNAQTLLFERYYNAQFERGFQRVYIGSKENLKANLAVENMKEESLPNIYLDEAKLIYGTFNDDYTGYLLKVMDISSMQNEFIETGVRVFSHSQASFSGSPNENIIVASKETSKNLKYLYILYPETDQRIVLSDSTKSSGIPAFSPDGNKIAYFEADQVTKIITLVLVNKDGTNREEIFEFTETNLFPLSIRWLNSDVIACSLIEESNDGENNKICIINTKTGEAKYIASPSMFVPGL